MADPIGEKFAREQQAHNFSHPFDLEGPNSRESVIKTTPLPFILAFHQCTLFLKAIFMSLKRVSVGLMLPSAASPLRDPD